MLKAYVAFKNRVSGRRGQNTVEYLLMLAAVVGLVIALSAIMKTGLNEVWTTVKDKVISAVGTLGK